MRDMMRFSYVLGLLLCASAALAQNSNSGDIRGTAADATGAVIQGAIVTVTDIDKGVTTTYVTDQAGLYDTGSIVTDHYTVTFTKSGFDTFVRGPITLNNETLTINGTLKVGSSTETVTVTTDVPLLQTESGTQTTTLSEQEMQDLPNFASWENFTTLMPGSSGTSAPGAQGGMNPGQAASVNGNAVFYNVLGDGVTMSFPSNGNSYDYNFDTLQEVQMVTSIPSAQYENGGAIYNQISKGGSSSFHGDVFDYFQNSYLNAATYAFGQGYVPALRANYYGGSFSGPVPIGALKKKLFFFFNYDRQQYYGGANSGFVTVPTAAMLSGDFTGQTTTLADGTTVPLLVYDPTTQKLVTSGTYQDAGADPPQTCSTSSPCLERQSFASEYGNGNKIPSGMIDSVAQAMEAYFPKPNVANPTVVNGITTNNYFYNWASNSPSWAYFFRVDYDITSKNRFTATDFHNVSSSPYYGISICPIDCYTANGDGRTAQISDVWTFSPNKINEFRFGFNSQNNLYIPESVGLDFPSKLGLKFAEANIFPEVYINGACCFNGNMSPTSNAIQHQLLFEPSDVVTMIKGRHVLHFGGEFLDQEINTTFWGNLDAGAENYSGQYTQDTQGDSYFGLAFADFLLGQVNSWSAANTPEFYPRMKTVQLFVQDDFKLKPNFTLNAGVRWEGWNGMYDAHGNERSWDPTVVNPAANPMGETNTLGAMWYGSTHANGRTKVIAPIWNTFLPRFGFSWQMDSNTVVRGGFGLYAYNFNEGPSAYSELGSELGSSGNESDNTNGILPVVILDQDGTVNDQGSAGTSIAAVYQAAPTNPDSLNGQGVNFAYYHEPLTKIWQYNLEIQRQLGPDMAAKIAYVGSHGFDQLFGVDLNQIPEADLGPNDTTGATDARPFPNFQSIGGNKLIGVSNYNALQATAERRMSSGLDFNFNYTWSKFLNETDACAWNCPYGTAQNMYDVRADYGPAAFDVRHMFKGRLVYKLPVGKGQKFLNNSTIADEVVGGWQTSATIQWQTGNPFTVVTANNNDYAQSGAQYPNVVPGVNPYAGAHQIGPNSNWFNEAAFSQPDAGTYGNSRRDTLRAPGYSNINFSLGKNFNIWEKTTFLLRIDASNVLNHPSFGQPNANWGPGQISSISSVTDGGRSAEILGKISF
jgi:hypothetical protein